LVQPVRSLAHSPLFQVTFTWNEGLVEGLDLPGLERGPLRRAPHMVSRFDMALLLQEFGERVVGGVEDATALFEAETVERYVGYFIRLLEGMVAGGERQAPTAVDEVNLLGEAERRQVVVEWNRTKAEYELRCVHEMFGEQAAVRPEAIAVVCEEEQV